MATEIRTRVTSGRLSAGQQANVLAGFDTGFIFNNDSSSSVILRHEDGSEYTMAPGEVFHFPYTHMPYESVVFVAGGTCKFSFTSTSRISITIT